ncbi:hypothetical protein V5799_031422 [Amblyomma americanum]|uniref:Myosin tail domain-containing protein n=1 Tax=Amblyomma americanum TaxID=6943 RepID=A0AAQ4EKF0_AMBAM
MSECGDARPDPREEGHKGHREVNERDLDDATRQPPAWLSSAGEFQGAEPLNKSVNDAGGRIKTASELFDGEVPVDRHLEGSKHNDTTPRTDLPVPLVKASSATDGTREGTQGQCTDNTDRRTRWYRDLKVKAQQMTKNCGEFGRNLAAIMEKLEDERSSRIDLSDYCEILEKDIKEARRRIDLLETAVSARHRTEQGQLVRNETLDQQREMEETRSFTPQTDKKCGETAMIFEDLEEELLRVTEHLMSAERSRRAAEAERDELRNVTSSAFCVLKFLLNLKRKLEGNLHAASEALKEEKQNSQTAREKLREVKALADMLKVNLEYEEFTAKRFKAAALFYKRQNEQLRCELDNAKRACCSRLQSATSQSESCSREKTSVQAAHEPQCATTLRDPTFNRAALRDAYLDTTEPMCSLEKEPGWKLQLHVEETSKLREKCTSAIAGARSQLFPPRAGPISPCSTEDFTSTAQKPGSHSRLPVDEQPGLPDDGLGEQLDQLPL